MKQSSHHINTLRKGSKRKNRKSSLQKKILLPFLTLIILSGAIISTVSLFSSVNITTDELTDSVESQVTNVNDTFEMFFHHTDGTLERLSLLDIFMNLEGEKDTSLEEIFQQTEETNEEMMAIYLGLEKDGSTVIYPEADVNDMDARERPWYEDAIAAEGEVVWTEAMKDVITDDIVVTGAKAIYDGESLVGVIGVDVKVDTLIDMVNRIEIGETGYGIILDETGNYIAHPNEDVIGEDGSSEVFYEEVTTAGERGVVEFEAEGESKVMGFAKNPTTGWIIGGTVNENEFKKKALGVLVPISIVLVTMIVIAVVVSIFASRRITKPIHTVMERMQRIADGELTHEHLHVTTNDEVGQLMDATNDMQDHMRTLLTRIHTVAETVTSQSEELTQSAHEVKQGSEQVASTMEELASAAELEANHTTELASTMQDFAKGVDEASQHGEQIQETSIEVLEITTEGRDLMDSSKGQMEKIDEIVHDAVQKMQGLNVQKQEISKLISVIQGIAEQTNLLALNAAIEAARAGEHGQGFAVVANEVRKLAEQVSDSVTEITDIVTNIQGESTVVVDSLQGGYQEVAQGTSQIEVTSEKFVGIQHAIEEMADHVTATSESLTHIVANTQQMNSSIEEIAAVSEEAAAGVEQTSASSEEISASMEEVSDSSNDLSQLAEELNSLLRRFKL